MNRDVVIKRFKEACKHPSNNRKRELAVITQHDRDVWEVSDANGQLVIMTYDNKYLIVAMNNPRYTKINKASWDETEYDITKRQYNELKKIFFGIYKPNFHSLKETGSKPKTNLSAN